MTIERLRKILNFNQSHHDEMKDTLKTFCQKLAIDSFDDVRDIMQIIRLELVKQNLLVMQLPLKDEEIGGFIYQGDAFSYIVCNSSLPVVTSNFAFCHELYHAFFPVSKEKNVMEVEYFNTEEDSLGNLFAANILMPENVFKKMFHKFQDDDELTEIVSLMNFFKAPFMAVYIRCYELGLFTENSVKEEILNISVNEIERKFDELWFDKRILQASYIDDSAKVINYVTEKGHEYVEGKYISERTLNIIIGNLNSLFSEIKVTH